MFLFLGLWFLGRKSRERKANHMKIAIVCFNLDLLAGGPRLIFSLARSLQNEGNAVVIYTPSFSGKYFHDLWEGLTIKIVPGSEKLRLSSNPSGFLDWLRHKLTSERIQYSVAKNIALAMDTDFDVVNLHDFAYRVAWRYRVRNPNAKIMWTENDPPYAYLPKKNIVAAFLSKTYNQYKDFESKRDFRAIDTVTVLDFYNRDWCEARGIRAIVSRLGVDFKNFYHPVKNFAPRAKKKAVRLMGLGSLNPYRRYEDIVMAVKSLRDRGYDAEALIICNDTWNESAYRKELTDLVLKHDLGSAITFMFAGVSEKELRAAFKSADVFIYSVYLPPPRNGFGFSIGALEAIAAGLPLVVCNTTTSSEVLKDGKTALFVDPKSPEQIAEKIKLLVDDPKVYQQIATDGQRFVRTEMTWKKYTDLLLTSLHS